MFNLTKEQADAIFLFANIIGICAAIVAAAATAVAFVSSGIRDRYDEQRMSANEAQADTAKAEAAKANTETERLKNENLKLQQAIDEEKAGRARVEAQVRPRRLTNPQVKAMQQTLRGHQFKVYMSCFGHDDCQQFAESLHRSLRASGIDARIGNVITGAPPFNGLGVEASRDPILYAALASAGLPVVVLPDKDDQCYLTGRDTSVIVVGGKPQVL